jgi:uncharacterized membrane protein YfcA
VIVAVVIFIAVLVQSSVGFGLALVSMPLLAGLLGVHMAAPLVALVAITTESVVLWRFRRSFSALKVSRLAAAAIVGIPIGVMALRRFDARVVTTVLGVIVISYALYALAAPRLPALAGRGWAYGFGFAAGLLSGAYNTGGPPVIVYGSCQCWSPDEFKGNLQGFFIVSSLVVIASHALSGNLSVPVWQNFLYALPGIALGLLSGFYLGARVDPDLFRKAVLVLLLILGGWLIIS